MELGDDVASGQQVDPRTYAPKNLANVLESSAHLPVPDCVEIMLSLAAALDHLHQQRLIHRDIKPSNIIFVNGRPKLADIGLVTEMESDGQDVSDLGTKGYIAPEGPGTAAADVYSLGKVLYEMSMGRSRDAFPELPTNIFDRADQSVLMQLNRIILKACENDPTRRYQTAAELRADLLAQWPRAQGVVEGRE
jgi:serine/threonine protein kinase